MSQRRNIVLERQKKWYGPALFFLQRIFRGYSDRDILDPRMLMQRHLWKVAAIFGAFADYQSEFGKEHLPVGMKNDPGGWLNIIRSIQWELNGDERAALGDGLGNFGLYFADFYEIEQQKIESVNNVKEQEIP